MAGYHVAALCCFAAVLCADPLKHRVPVIEVPGDVSLLHGRIREDQRTVTLSPALRILEKSGPVCSYEIFTEENRLIPFVVDVAVKETGEATLRLTDGASVDCTQPKFAFSLVAVRCKTNERSESVDVEVVVEDINDHSPEFDEPWYTVEVDEGRLYGEMTRLRATDADCGHPYGEICRYEITNTLGQLPFVISDDGVLRNTEPLNRTQSASHILSVIAHDCGMRRSKPTLVTIKVRHTCLLGLSGVPERIAYYPGVGSKLLAPTVGVELCDAACVVERAEAVVRLRTEHIGRGCDRDPFSAAERRQTCGIDADTVDLLPRPQTLRSDDENDAVEDPSNEAAAEEVYLFDGEKNAIIIPADTASSHLPTVFSLSFWMKHARPGKEAAGAKESIVCSSDDSGMNRHHFDVYIRHCKLELLERREHSAHAENKFRPAEWRWQLEQACDDQWHHYAFNFRFPDVQLFVDGRPFAGAVEVLDDWPMHKTKDDNARLVVGACWHGRDQQMRQFFKGYLSSMLYLADRTETAGALQCLHQCREQLQFAGLEHLVPGEEAIFNNEMSTLTLKADNAADLVQLVGKVSYVNLRHTPTAGHRGFDIHTKLSCKNQTNPLQLPDAKGYIFVEQTPEPRLLLTGTTSLTHTRAEVKAGAKMLADLTISVVQPDADGKEKDTSSKHKLDWCRVHLQPVRDVDHEYFSSPAALIGSLRLDFEHDHDGVELRGIEGIHGYESVLTEIHYFNLQPSDYAQRHYTLECSMLNGRVLSNKLPIIMYIDPDSQAVTPQTPEPSLQLHAQSDGLFNSHKKMSAQTFDVPGPQAAHHGLAGAKEGSVAGGALAVVVVVCVGFLLVLLVVGVVRMRGARDVAGRRRYRQPTDGDLTWDDAGLNITVNPIDVRRSAVVAQTPAVQEVTAGANDAAGYSDDDDESSDDGDRCGGAAAVADVARCSFGDDELTSGAEDDDDTGLPYAAAGVGGGGSLEWDDSTLHQPNGRVASYRV